MCTVRYEGGPLNTVHESLTDDATIARETYNCLVHSYRRLLSKFQLNQARIFVLTGF